ncbi:bifunctional protein-serine/threonine kinase/phosphatase [Marinimicrobium sp. ABcell2]|uniref:bifunctional protein-serine/threonine kinase/phosphatase n=1 Tax=Marinimicrobium sp. ABcell2 TaxID=3069751 RepID=UPI0027ADBF33|nr:bifunctional protein-serine/threonine kinase/phosphatase [Marinimicrobium sp. ABcell2]MDQ2076049.1 bifunctional protein-serine/threonine kinase/phosphatase [Marinimicrobium sp. ABcell2]
MDHLQSTLRIAFAQRSEAGRKPENQDTLGARLPEDQQLTSKGIAMAIADGVSSSDAAREASQTAIIGFLTDYYATPDTWRTGPSAVQVIQALNRSLWGRSRNSVLGQGYLTTFSALILKGDTGFIFHVGDTRVYLLRDGELELLTRDHNQRIDEDTVYLSRALGADLNLEVDMHSVQLQPNDVFVLTSDGIHDSLSATELSKLVNDHQQDVEALVAQGIARALDAGSTDNLSIQAARIEQTGHASQDDAVRVLSRLPFPPLLEPGQSLDGLTVKKILHESNRSQVYLVEDDAGRAHIMKTPSRLHDDDPAYLERFVMEAWIGARIHSPYVVRVVTPPQARSSLYYLTEYVPGPTLGQMLSERGKLDIPDAVEMIGYLIRGIRAFHRKETLHQDLKPDNIVLSRNGPVIVDFGSCWVAGVAEIQTPILRDKILGTLDYSAPEYRYGGETGPHSDQFSLAVLLYKMLTGKSPFGSAYGKAMDLKSFQKLRYRPASRINPLVPFWLDKALEKALSINPNHRYDALSEWLQDLQRPNPRWASPGQQPLLERDPEQVWQAVAAIGWGFAVLLAFMLFS